MVNYIIYDTNTGQIIQTGNGDITLYQGIIASDQTIIASDASIDDAIDISTGEIIEDGASAFTSYIENRINAYPDYTVYLDAQVKINSNSLELIEEGKAQLAQYYTDCLAVKTLYPVS